MTAPPLLAALVGQDVAHRWGFLPLIYLVYGAAAVIALRGIPETSSVAFEDLDGRDPSPGSEPIPVEAR